MKRVFIVLLAIVLLAGGVGYYYAATRPKETAAPPTATVTTSNIEQTVLATGVLNASSLVSVGAQVSGLIKKVDVSRGQTVKAGDPLVEIDATNQQNALANAEAALANIKAQRTVQQIAADQAKKALDRANNLGTRGLVSGADVESAQAALTTAKAHLQALDAQIKQATIAVQSAKVDLAHTKIVAPVSGTIVAVLVDAGQTINANSAAPLVVKIANLNTMEIKAEISEADVIKVKPGQKVYFTILGAPDKRINATLKSIDPAPASIATSDTPIPNSAVYYDGIFEVPNPNHELRIAMTAEVTIVTAEAKDALSVPSSALRGPEPGGKYFVGVWDEATKTIKRAAVSVGLNNKIDAQITSGLKQGQQVVVTGVAGAPGAGGPGGRGRLRSPLGF